MQHTFSTSHCTDMMISFSRLSLVCFERAKQHMYVSIFPIADGSVEEIKRVPQIHLCTGSTTKRRRATR